MKKDDLSSALTFGGLVAAAALLGSAFGPRGSRKKWYDSLEKSALNPPKAVFPIVWSGLYTLMAISGWRVARQTDHFDRRGALALWGTQLGLNALWSPIFFGAKKPALALADLVALFSVLTAYTVKAGEVDREAGWMMVPYLAWVGFAGALNREIVRRNPTRRRQRLLA